ncbi:hypothetical protein MTsN4n12_13720 [Microbacterium sp. MTN4-12]
MTWGAPARLGLRRATGLRRAAGLRWAAGLRRRWGGDAAGWQRRAAAGRRGPATIGCGRAVAPAMVGAASPLTSCPNSGWANRTARIPGLPAVPGLLHPELVHTSGVTPGRHRVETLPHRATDDRRRRTPARGVTCRRLDGRRAPTQAGGPRAAGIPTSRPYPNSPSLNWCTRWGETPVRHRVDHPVPRQGTDGKDADARTRCELSGGLTGDVRQLRLDGTHRAGKSIPGRIWTSSA